MKLTRRGLFRKVLDAPLKAGLVAGVAPALISATPKAEADEPDEESGHCYTMVCSVMDERPRTFANFTKVETRFVHNLDGTTDILHIENERVIYRQRDVR